MSITIIHLHIQELRCALGGLNRKVITACRLDSNLRLINALGHSKAAWPATPQISLITRN